MSKPWGALREGVDVKEFTTMKEQSGWGYVVAPCGHRVYGVPDDIDSGMRKHRDYCDDWPDDDVSA